MTNEILQKVKIPAIGLIITGVLNILLGLYFLVSSAFQMYMGVFNRPFTSEAEKIGFYVGFFGSTGLGVLGIFIAPVIIYGAVKMMRGKKYGLAKIAAILAIVPLTSCCFIAGVPFGIWAFVVLRQPDVKAFFEGTLDEQKFNPPPPRQNF